MAIVLNNKGLDQPKKQTTTNTSTYATLKYGSQGVDVKRLQTELGFSGADIDGIFGQKTQQAVIDYQKANNLDPTGVAGNDFLKMLYEGTAKAPTTTVNTNTSANTSTLDSVPMEGNELYYNRINGTTPTTKPTTTPTTTDTEKETETKGDYSEEYKAVGYSQEVIDAFDILNQYRNDNRPGAYTPVWQDEADAYLTQYQNRDPFSYDFNADSLYNQYKDQYIQQGRMAMMDTMGQAAAMTGGYGSTYAQTVGQQAYNQQLGQLNEIIPELYGMAYDRYNQEGRDLLDMYDIYMGKEQNEYEKYQDSLTNYYRELESLQNDANTKYSRWLNQNVGENAADYTALTFDEYKNWTKTFEAAEKVEDVELLGDMLEASGYDPYFVAKWTDFYKARLLGGGGGSDAPPAGVFLGELNTEGNRLTF